jgi:hypothetical protein
LPTIKEKAMNQKTFDEAVLKNALNVSLYSDDLKKMVTVRNYLKELLLTLWKEKEGFSGKRPFGNSGWHYDLYGALIAKRYITGYLDNDGYVESVDGDEADAFISKLIEFVFKE